MKEKQFYLFSSEREKKIPKKQYAIVLPLDTFVLLSVIIILFFALTFSFGVERGRRIAYLDRESLKEPADLPEAEEIPDTEAVSVKEEGKEIKDSEEKIGSSDKYIIQVATYTRKDIALKEIEKLKDNGFSVSTSQRGKYLIIYVGEFDKEEAEKNEELLEKRYGDCILRRL